jgi:8-oxo-dGTP pyrophosphatase MutT (NUDIX family)
MSEPRPSSTVVVIRDAGAGIEVLLLERNADPVAWVFPGGKVDEADRAAAAGDEGRAARLAAVREAAEEAGLVLDAGELLPISRWITPEISAKRFDTLFFLARAGAQTAVRVDGGEIRSHRWLAPQQALEEHRARGIRLAPPTFVTVTWLTRYADAESAARSLASRPLVTFRPRICQIAEGACILYPGDAGYDDADASRAGPRHRLWTLREGWRYERD